MVPAKRGIGNDDYAVESSRRDGYRRRYPLISNRARLGRTSLRRTPTNARYHRSQCRQYFATTRIARPKQLREVVPA
jgi:hypothetical protein